MDVPRGTKVRVKLGEIDEITLDISGTLIERLDATAVADAPPEDEDEDEIAGPIAIAVDVSGDDAAGQIGDNQSP